MGTIFPGWRFGKAVHVMGVDVGDEVITSPDTFIAADQRMLIDQALPVFAGTEPATLAKVA